MEARFSTRTGLENLEVLFLFVAEVSAGLVVVELLLLLEETAPLDFGVDILPLLLLGVTGLGLLLTPGVVGTCNFGPNTELSILDKDLLCGSFPFVPSSVLTIAFPTSFASLAVLGSFGDSCGLAASIFGPTTSKARCGGLPRFSNGLGLRSSRSRMR